jgi:hypothetical protein
VHRRGLDGPSVQKPLSKTTTRICPNRQARHGAAGESFL